jgi:hypothetical protein
MSDEQLEAALADLSKNNRAREEKLAGLRARQSESGAAAAISEGAVAALREKLKKLTIMWKNRKASVTGALDTLSEVRPAHKGAETTRRLWSEGSSCDRNGYSCRASTRRRRSSW